RYGVMSDCETCPRINTLPMTATAMLALGPVVCGTIESLAKQPHANHVADPLPAKFKVLVARDLPVEYARGVVVERVVHVTLRVLTRQEVRPRSAVLDDRLDRLDV